MYYLNTSFSFFENVLSSISGYFLSVGHFLLHSLIFFPRVFKKSLIRDVFTLNFSRSNFYNVFDVIYVPSIE